MPTHEFTPTAYHHSLGPHDPVLHIADGDTVVTTTVCTFGHDASDERVTGGGNAQTGPFFIDGAEPGDTLAIHLDKLAPNRPIGRTFMKIAGNVLDPWYTPDPIPEDSHIAEWTMDLDSWTATLTSPQTGLGDFTMPLDQAVQHATTEMVRWLKADYGLDEQSAHILLGQCVEYDVGNVFDPAYSMACKVRKDLVPNA